MAAARWYRRTTEEWRTQHRRLGTINMGASCDGVSLRGKRDEAPHTFVPSKPRQYMRTDVAPDELSTTSVVSFSQPSCPPRSAKSEKYPRLTRLPSCPQSQPDCETCLIVGFDSSPLILSGPDKTYCVLVLRSTQPSVEQPSQCPLRAVLSR